MKVEKWTLPKSSFEFFQAIEILKKDDDGFFLLVEAGRLDHAHHAGWAHVAMEEFLELERAVEVCEIMYQNPSKQYGLQIPRLAPTNVCGVDERDVERRKSGMSAHIIE